MLPATSPAISNMSLELLKSTYETQFLIPHGHSATLLGLLSLPALRCIVGDLPKSHFFDLEETDALPRPLDLFQSNPIHWPSLDDVEHLQGLADAYFSDVSAHLPLLTRQSYEEIQNRLLTAGPSQDVETAICLCVWALGSMARNALKPAVPENAVDLSQDLGIHFFSVALRIIVSKTVWALKPSPRVCQALMLAATYFSYLGKPLYSWRMIHFASQMLLGIFNW